MGTEASADALMKQAETLRAAAEVLSPKLGDLKISAKDRKKLFEQFQALHAQAFALTTLAAENVVKELSVDVTSLQSTIEKGTNVLATVKHVKDMISLATTIVQTATAVATGQPLAIAQSLTALEAQIDKVAHK